MGGHLHHAEGLVRSVLLEGHLNQVAVSGVVAVCLRLGELGIPPLAGDGVSQGVHGHGGGKVRSLRREHLPFLGQVGMVGPHNVHAVVQKQAVEVPPHLGDFVDILVLAGMQRHHKEVAGIVLTQLGKLLCQLLAAGGGGGHVVQLLVVGKAGLRTAPASRPSL